ncbi:uncharacterized protein LOC121976479 [Zingiber officinale]|uniref:SWIM-type domain-containing protein n=1 Tax=Zingiber officinale TaxID=94328 RepID=A0A8J5LF36_ZINOF|nr:uncharacterized protein LOC121976479 [Zingiber officinale]XP_042384584.1 uncharacterized protein LOC121976479 [Zingiber officinale]XP_042384586.1 uncharacterized protein LOC121976479 [Zingiber officinale]XP_042384587.1 uncharacterized protein LOC121976479 [Zingiber officinale]KAG6512202.1 hypothetical protein ZIOFF_030298 [Zingiber officinale]
MEDFSFVVGQQFADVKTFRRAIKEAAISQHFELKIIKSDLIRYFAKCAKDSCPWRIRAVKLPNAPTFTVRSIEGTHTCNKDAQQGHHQASIDWIVNLIEERLRSNVNYRPKDILQDIQRQYGITIPYKQAWRAKERGLTAIYGSSEEGYSLLPAYCEQIKLRNPGSVAQVYTIGVDHQFHKIFVSFSALIYGFLNGCLPIICLGSTELRSKYLGTLLSVTSFDPDGGVFPIAFGIVDVETEESWNWFLSEFYKSLEISCESRSQLTVLSNGQTVILEAVRRNFPTACQGICMRYFTESVNKEFKNSRLVHLLWKAAYSVSASSFQDRMAEIEEICAEAAKRIQQIPPTYWAVASFEGSRYGHLSSNIEEFNRWILETRELPILQVIESIHGAMIKEFNERCEKGLKWASRLVPSAERRISDAIKHSVGYQALRSDEFEFEVLSANCSNIVNIGIHCCSCHEWQLYGIPCSHAIAALLSCNKDIYEYTDRYFTVARYRETYSHPVCPIPDRSEWYKASESSVDSETQIVCPPKVRRPPGRPEKKRLNVEETNHEKHTVHCSRCNQTGHYKRTCKADITHKT